LDPSLLLDLLDQLRRWLPLLQLDLRGRSGQHHQSDQWLPAGPSDLGDLAVLWDRSRPQDLGGQLAPRGPERQSHLLDRSDPSPPLDPSRLLDRSGR